MPRIATVPTVRMQERALHVEPGRVEHQRGQVRPAVRRPTATRPARRSSGRPARRGRGRRARRPATTRRRCPRSTSCDVVDVVGRLVLAQRAAVLAQVERVEVVAAARSTTRRTRSGRSSRRSRARRAPPGPVGSSARPAHQVRLDGALARRARARGLDGVRRAEDVGRQVAGRRCSRLRSCHQRGPDAARRTVAGHAAISGCHCTPRQKRSARRAPSPRRCRPRPTPTAT